MRARVTEGSWRSLRQYYRAAAVGVDGLIVVVLVGAVAAASANPVALLAACSAAASFVAAVALCRGYDTRLMGAGGQEYGALLKAGGVLAGAFVVAGYLGLDRVPPEVVAITVAGVVATTVLLRAAQRGALAILRSRGHLLSRTLVVGGQEQVADTTRLFMDTRHGHRLVGACLQDGAAAPSGVSVLGDIDDVGSVVRDHDVDSIVIDPSVMTDVEFRRFRWAMEAHDIEVLVTTDVTEMLPSRVSLRVIDAAPMLEVRTRPSRTQRLLKLTTDRTLAALLLLLVSPLLLATMVAVRSTSPGGAIFRQLRIGSDGRPFTMLKLRTMSANAESLKSAVANANGAGPLFKSRQDPRITPLGRILRRYSIDELPQLWNVLRGDMSLVGPRPPLPSEVATYDAMVVHRLHVRPGLTGLWQVSGRSDLSWEQAVRLDLLYVDNWSMLLDLKILWRTARAIFAAEGAY